MAKRHLSVIAKKPPRIPPVETTEGRDRPDPHPGLPFFLQGRWSWVKSVFSYCRRRTMSDPAGIRGRTVRPHSSLAPSTSPVVLVRDSRATARELRTSGHAGSGERHVLGLCKSWDMSKNCGGGRQLCCFNSEEQSFG